MLSALTGGHTLKSFSHKHQDHSGSSGPVFAVGEQKDYSSIGIYVNLEIPYRVHLKIKNKNKTGTNWGKDGLPFCSENQYY